MPGEGDARGLGAHLRARRSNAGMSPECAHFFDRISTKVIEPHWTAYLTALATPIVAMVAAGIAAFFAYQQWRTARNKLKLDLFERRFAVYHAAQSFLASIGQNGKATGDDMQRFAIGTAPARWLFGPDLAEFLSKEVWAKAVELQMLEAELEGLPVSKERTDNVQKQSAVKKTLFGAPKRVDSGSNPSFGCITDCGDPGHVRRGAADAAAELTDRALFEPRHVVHGDPSFQRAGRVRPRHLTAAPARLRCRRLAPAASCSIPRSGVPNELIALAPELARERRLVADRRLIGIDWARHSFESLPGLSGSSESSASPQPREGGG